MLLVERHTIKGTPEIVRLCEVSKELYNKCNFLMRRAWFGGNLLPNINDLVAAVKNEDCFKQLHNTKTAKQTVRKCLTDWTNFKKALNAWKKDQSKFVKMPMPPYYKDKLAQVIGRAAETAAACGCRVGTPTRQGLPCGGSRP